MGASLAEVATADFKGDLLVPANSYTYALVAHNNSDWVKQLVPGRSMLSDLIAAGLCFCFFSDVEGERSISPNTTPEEFRCRVSWQAKCRVSSWLIQLHRLGGLRVTHPLGGEPSCALKNREIIASSPFGGVLKGFVHEQNGSVQLLAQIKSRFRSWWSLGGFGDPSFLAEGPVFRRTSRGALVYTSPPFRANGPPREGLMELVPRSGEGLLTPFAVSSFGWRDEEESLLSYSFFRPSEFDGQKGRSSFSSFFQVSFWSQVTVSLGLITWDMLAAKFFARWFRHSYIGVASSVRLLFAQPRISFSRLRRVSRWQWWDHLRRGLDWMVTPEDRVEKYLQQHVLPEARGVDPPNLGGVLSACVF